MIHALELQLKSSPEILERVLRVTRHRGFKVTNMNMTAENGNIFFALTVETERRIELLSNQLNKLVDVYYCQVLPQVLKTKEAIAR